MFDEKQDIYILTKYLTIKLMNEGKRKNNFIVKTG